MILITKALIRLRKSSAYFWGFKILNFNVCLFFFLFFFAGGGGGGGGGDGFQKNKYFLGMKKLWIFFVGHYKTGLFCRYFLGMPKFLIFLEVISR